MFKGKRELPTEYYDLRKAYSYAKTDSDKLALLEKMLEVIPAKRSEFNKVRSYTTHLMRIIRSRIAKKEKREEAEAHARLFFKTKMFSIALIGDSNTGKTRLLNSLCDTDHSSTYEPFETKKPIIGVFAHGDKTLRIVEVPSAIKPKHAKILRECDLIIVMPDSDRFIDYLEDVGVETPVKVLESYPKDKWGFLDLIVVKVKGDTEVFYKGVTLNDLGLEKAQVNGVERRGSYVLKDLDVIS